jgi:serine/threonine-protein phosphatase PGAM5
MAIKTVLLLRHGQYKNKPEEKLTKLGRRQAELSGLRLKDFKINRIIHSTMPRALETAMIVKEKMKYRKAFESTDLLRECVPGFPLDLRQKYGYVDEQKLEDSIRILDQAYEKYFEFSAKKTTELLVCHGNVIRYLLCRALRIDTIKWMDFDIRQCGLTMIQLDSKLRRVTVIAHNDAGHIPFRQQTFI